MPPAEPRPGTPEHWLKRADSHRAIAAQPKPPIAYWEELAYHAQQCVEFAIKAIYQLHNAAFPFTHDLDELLDGLQRLGISIPAEIRAAGQLTRYAVRTRYPGLAPPVTEQDHAEALRLASTVLEWARSVTARTGGT